MEYDGRTHRDILIEIARRAMLERGLNPDFTPQALAELKQFPNHTPTASSSIRDLRNLPWSSVDNDDSRDLDQLTAAEPLPGGFVKILAAIADVDVLVQIGSALDENAALNTTSVYTPAILFPMLPEKLSTDLTSLNPDQDRLAIVIEMVITEQGSLYGADVYRALVRNHAKLAYDRVAAWLDGEEEIPEAVAVWPGLDENLRIQDQVALKMKDFRHSQGALTLETIESVPVFAGDKIQRLEVARKNRAKRMIENFMIAANGVTARFLSSHGFPSIRRVVLAPRRWDRIVELAQEQDFKLPGAPDSLALEAFLTREKREHPQRFSDLSLTVVKLLGAGEYVAEPPDDRIPDHFGLAAQDYTHSTAPNRRYTDLITQRLIKAALEGRQAPYTLSDLEVLAKHCTRQEDEVNKVERQADKAAAALLLEKSLGSSFDAIVTGASPKGTWVRLVNIPVEGRLVAGFKGLDVGHRLRVELISVDIEQGFIDFRKTGRSKR